MQPPVTCARVPHSRQPLPPAPRPSRLAPVPSPLDALVLRCLAKDPARRFTDAELLRQAFFQTIGPRGPAERPMAAPLAAQDAASRSAERPKSQPVAAR